MERIGPCRTCKFRQPDGRKDYVGAGYCRRFPPQIIALTNANGDVGIEQHFPWMPSDDPGCGEHERED